MTSSKKEVVQTDACPKPFPVMPFSAAVKSNGMVYLSGNIGMDPKTNKLVEGDIKDRTVNPHSPLASHYSLPLDINPDKRLMYVLENDNDHHNKCT